MRVNNQTAPFCHHDSNSSREEGEGTPDLPDPRMANRAMHESAAIGLEDNTALSPCFHDEDA